MVPLLNQGMNMEKNLQRIVRNNNFGLFYQKNNVVDSIIFFQSNVLSVSCLPAFFVIKRSRQPFKMVCFCDWDRCDALPHFFFSENFTEKWISNGFEVVEGEEGELFAFLLQLPVPCLFYKTSLIALLHLPVMNEKGWKSKGVYITFFIPYYNFFFFFLPYILDSFMQNIWVFSLVTSRCIPVYHHLEWKEDDKKMLGLGLDIYFYWQTQQNLNFKFPHWNFSVCMAKIKLWQCFEQGKMLI